MFRRPKRPDAQEPPGLIVWSPDADGEDGPPGTWGECDRPDGPGAADEQVEVVQTGDGPLGAALEQLREGRAARGFRPGGFGDLPERRGAAGEVVTSVVVRPGVAAAVAAAGGLFRPPVAGLSVDQRSLDTARQTMSWQVTLRLGPLVRRRATLRLQPSASANLTILEMVPNRRVRWHERAFVRAGVRAADELADRLQHAGPSPAIG